MRDECETDFDFLKSKYFWWYFVGIVVTSVYIQYGHSIGFGKLCSTCLTCLRGEVL